MWARIEDTMWSDPTVVTTPRAALGLWLLLSSWSAQQCTDGVVEGPVFDRLFGDAYDDLQQLLKVGLVHDLVGRVQGKPACPCLADTRANEGYYLHQHLRRNPASKDLEAGW